MANTAIQNIKILHKRYTSVEWLSGLTVNGKHIIPKLAQGEIGLDTTTLEVRIGTSSAAEQTWAQAHVIDAEVVKSATYYHKDGTNGNSAKDTETYVITNCDIENTSEGKHKLALTYKSIELIAPKAPDLVVTDGTATASEGEVVVVTGISEGGEHEVVSTKATAATKGYVDGRKLTITDNEDGMFITKIVESNANGNHTITVERADAIIETPELEIVNPEIAGDFVSGISVNDHKITIAKGNLPVGTGSKTSGDLEFIDSVQLDGHTLSATTKGIKGDNNVITVSKDTDGKILVSADTYTKEEIDQAHNELAKAMKFAGTLDSTGVNGLASLPSNAKQGDVYKVAHAGTYGSQAAKVGDLFIYDGKAWRYVPSGDESFTDTWRGITINNGATTVKDNSIGGGAIDFAGGNAMSVTAANGTITISHNDTSSAENLTKKSRQYVDGLTFDEYGHVTGYTVGEEVDQFIPSASGEEVAGTLEVISGVSLGTDATGNHVLTADVKGFSGDSKLVDVSETNGTIKVSHKTVTTTATNGTDATIVAGGTNNSFTVVDSVSNDSFGHITDVKTKTITVNIPEEKDTTYDLSATQNSTTTGLTSADINLTAGGTGSGVDKVAFKVDAATTTPVDGLQVSVSGDTITLSGKATKDLLGLIRAAYNLDTAASGLASDSYIKNYTGDLDRLYGVNVRTDGKAFVEVPWTDTHVVEKNFDSTSDAVKNVDMYAFNTDEYGHVEAVYAITTIDGNYA